mmetsp:Transcript_9062/g.22418  ORF Transcript_9062/g.22418 Transcript_9062/m.22418 type:complete len:204 (-) Transcript_9062:544-1155(-)
MRPTQVQQRHMGPVLPIQPPPLHSLQQPLPQQQQLPTRTILRPSRQQLPIPQRRQAQPQPPTPTLPTSSGSRRTQQQRQRASTTSLVAPPTTTRSTSSSGRPTTRSRPQLLARHLQQIPMPATQAMPTQAPTPPPPLPLAPLRPRLHLRPLPLRPRLQAQQPPSPRQQGSRCTQAVPPVRQVTCGSCCLLCQQWRGKAEECPV